LSILSNGPSIGVNQGENVGESADKLYFTSGDLSGVANSSGNSEDVGGRSWVDSIVGDSESQGGAGSDADASRGISGGCPL